MKTRKTSVRSLFAALLVTSVLAIPLGAGAQDAGAGHPGRGHRHDPAQMQAHMQERMQERLEAMRVALSLSAAQVDQLRAIFTETGERMRAIHESEGLSREERRDAMRTLHWSTDDRIHAMLTPDQREALRHFRREHREEGGPGRGRGFGRGHGRGRPEGRGAPQGI